MQARRRWWDNSKLQTLFRCELRRSKWGPRPTCQATCTVKRVVWPVFGQCLAVSQTLGACRQTARRHASSSTRQS